MLTLTKTIGMVAGAVALGAYFALRLRFGTGPTAAISCLLGLLVGVAVVAIREGV